MLPPKLLLCQKKTSVNYKHEHIISYDLTPVTKLYYSKQII